jgi:hypothetical protein
MIALRNGCRSSRLAQPPASARHAATDSGGSLAAHARQTGNDEKPTLAFWQAGHGVHDERRFMSGKAT